MKLLPLLLLISTLLGCSHPIETISGISPPKETKPIQSVVRYGPYVLASLSPTAAQRAPIEQIISYSIPTRLNATVADTMEYVLKGSGYRLCSPHSPAVTQLLQLPLPAIHRTMGPIRLNEALSVIAGPAWRLHIDDVNRTVCPVLKTSPAPTLS